MARFSSSSHADGNAGGSSQPEGEAPALPCADKLAFDSQRLASAAATVAAYQHGASLKPYVCRYCGLWHLTST